MVVVETIEMPATWRGKMETLFAMCSYAKVDRNGAEELVGRCAAVVDAVLGPQLEEERKRAKAKGRMNLSPLWSEILGTPLDIILRARGRKTKAAEEAAKLLLQCADYADQIEAERVKVEENAR